MQKPELLVPVGNPESFYAALEGGADAIYLGLQQFNARGRAKNFTVQQLPVILEKAHHQNVKVYITLNTVIKNKELPELIDYLHLLQESGADGVIIQDWGVFYMAHKYFPKLVLHASTQMGIHNSLGTRLAHNRGFRRVVLARELTLKELEDITAHSKIETEVFIHGALCYSFSGMCLYSSYAGGRGANRGLCAQPCRRVYQTSGKQKFLFNLKDNQQLNLIGKLGEMGVSSLKIEGRMKSGEYTYKVAKAYKKALHEGDLNTARQLLKLDFGREKTAYFLGNDVKSAVSEKTVAGVWLGRVQQVSGSKVWFTSKMKPEPGFRLRFHTPGSDKQETFRVDKFEIQNNLYGINTRGLVVKNNSEVYLSGMSDVKFPSKIEESKRFNIPKFPGAKKQNILHELKTANKAGKEEYYFRINSMEWLPFMNADQFEGLFLAFSKITWSRFDPQLPFIQENKEKIFIELPRFISEGSIVFYRLLVEKMVRNGVRNFVLGHLSQAEIIPKDSRIFTNENVYVFNDAASKCVQEEGIATFVYPQEIDFETLFSLSQKTGIVPVYFYPELFYSRMPVDVSDKNEISDSMNIKLRRYRRNGLTSVVPVVPVSISQSKNKLLSQGFYRFLIDLSYEAVSKNRIKMIKSRVVKSEQIQPSTTFNFNKGLQ